MTGAYDTPRTNACDALVFVLVRYRDGEGNIEESQVWGENVVGWSSDDVAGDFSAEHQIYFAHCQADCEVVFTTRPK